MSTTYLGPFSVKKTVPVGNKTIQLITRDWTTEPITSSDGSRSYKLQPNGQLIRTTPRPYKGKSGRRVYIKERALDRD